jgi:outer membrane biosynthesis protein TonB
MMGGNGISPEERSDIADEAVRETQMSRGHKLLWVYVVLLSFCMAALIVFGYLAYRSLAGPAEAGADLAEQVEAICDREGKLVGTNGKDICPQAGDVIDNAPIGSEVDDPESQDPETQDPEVQESETQDPEVQNPENQERESQDPEPGDDEIQNPEDQELESREPEIQDQESQDPEVDDKDPDDPENQDPEVNDPQDPPSKFTIENYPLPGQTTVCTRNQGSDPNSPTYTCTVQ